MISDDILSRYKKAQALMQGVLTNRLVLNDAVFPQWIDDSHFWYPRETLHGKEFRLVDAKNGTNNVAFDHAALASELIKLTSDNFSHKNLPITELVFDLSFSQMCFQACDKNWKFDLNSSVCEEIKPDIINGVYSPDGNKVAYVKDYNLFVRDLATGGEKALTKDGSKDYFYSCPANPAPGGGWSDKTDVQVLWSPDSKHIFTYQLDVRQVSSRPITYYAPADSVTPVFAPYKSAYPGDKYVETLRLISINVNTGQIQNANYPAIPFSAAGLGFFTVEKLGWWSTDSKRAYFIDVTRGAKTVHVVEFNTRTGDTRVIIEETSDTFVKLSHTFLSKPLYVPLPDSDELIWFSERTDWGHLYLYDLNTGKLKHAITEGDWLVRNVLHYNADHRELIIQTASRDKSISPHYRDISRVNIDSGMLTTIATGNFEHIVYQPCNNTVEIRAGFGQIGRNVNGVSPCGNYVVTTRSRVDTAPTSVLLDQSGEEILVLENTDLSGLPSDWVWPEPIKLKGSDKTTDVYGVMYRPPNFSEDKKYPVVDFSCGIRCFSYIPQGSFVNGPCFDYHYLAGAALATLGFIVVSVEARGTPNRNKAFQDHNYGDIASTCDLTDRIECIRQLAAKYPYMDLDRVGVTGGDNLAAPVYALLDHPDFYKVAVLHCYLDPRFYPAALGEQFGGIPANGNTTHQIQYAENRVESLKGKLLLIQGMLDLATASSTLRLVDALQKAGKDFDMLCLPNAYGDVPTYALRRNWDYLVKHLQDIDPPEAFQLTTGLDVAIDSSGFRI